MGDSSVSGPGISPSNPQSGLCARSKSNWPALLSTELNSGELHDESCGGATSSDILRPKIAPNGAEFDAQIDAISTETDLVTVSIGGNDEGLYTKIILSCLAGQYVSDEVCASFISTQLDPIVQRTTDRVAATLERIHAKAPPKARIVLVGYLRLVPDAGGCALPGLKQARVESAVAAWNALDHGLKTAATRADVDYVPMADKSRGHESCSGDMAWVNGMEAVPNDGALLHPNAAGMRAVAKAVADYLER